MKCATVTKVLLGRILLSLALLSASVFRQNIISQLYFILLLISPLLPISTNQQSFTGLFRGFVVAIIVYSVLICTGHVVFQLYLVIYGAVHHISYHDVITSCSVIDILQLVGFVRVDTPIYERHHAVRLILPDAIIAIVSILTYTIMCKVCKNDEPPLPENSSNPQSTTVGKTGFIKKAVQNSGEFFIILCIGLSSAMVPSLTSSVYFIVFLGVVLYWSLYLPFKQKYYKVFKFVMFIYLILHMNLLYICQFNYMQDILKENTYYSRLFGMEPLFGTNCSEPWEIILEPRSWPHYFNPMVLFITFTAIALDFAYHRTSSSHEGDESGDNPHSLLPGRHRSSERQRLVSTQTQQYNSVDSTPPASPARQITVRDEGSIGDVRVNPPTGEHMHRGFSIWSYHERPVLSTIRIQLLRISYLAAFVAMLMWAVLFPTWLAFAFLLVGCLIWLFPNSRKASLVMSPFLVIYAVGLTGLQYFCSINFGGIDYNSTLFFKPGEFIMESVGLVGYDYPVLYISIKLMFTVVFCSVLRAACYERSLARQRSSSTNQLGLCLYPLNSDSVTLEETDHRSVDNDNLKLIEKRIKDFLSKYWILLFYILLLVMAIQEPYIYRLVYMVLFLYSAITFQLSYKWWRISLKPFLLFVAIYSVIAIIFVYVLSFHTVLEQFQNNTRLNAAILADLGFDPEINYQESTFKLSLLWRLLVPACLLIAVMLQIHIFHQKFSSITDPHNMRHDRTLTESTIAEGNQSHSTPVKSQKRVGFVGHIVRKYNEWKGYGEDAFIAFCRFSNLHMYKIVFITASVVVTREVSATGLLLLVLLVFSLFFEGRSKMNRAVMLIAQFWIGIIILAKMLFQLKTVPKHYIQTNCSDSAFNTTNQADDAPWIGLRELKEHESLAYYVGGYVLLLVELTILAIFRTHQYYVEKERPEPKMHDGIIFTDINYTNYDNSIAHFLRFLANSAFFKFGLEICFLVTVIVISYRHDVVGGFYAFLLAVLLVCLVFNRRYVAMVWGQYFLILSLLLLIEYMSALGLPQGFCYAYPWESPELDTQLLWKWFYLPNYIVPPPVTVLLADCIQLLFVALQWHVFRAEKYEEDVLVKYSGSNKELGYKAPSNFSQMHDFIDVKRNFVDVIKSGVFSYGYWISIALLFITGTQNINFYCFGYLVFCFYFIWHGLDFTMKNLRSVVKWWNCVLFYNFAVIFCKAWLQLLGCVFLKHLLDEVADTEDHTKMPKSCYAVEFFSIRCLNPEFEASKVGQHICGVSPAEAGLTWDIICFLTLLLQRRIFMSSYFLIVICEDKTQAALASEGAKMISRMLKGKISRQRAQQQKDLRVIKDKIERIRLRTHRLGGSARDSWQHFDVIRTCEPYMLEDLDDDEVTTVAETSEDTMGLGSEFPSMADFSEAEKGSPFKMIVTAIDGGMKQSLDAVEKDKIEKSPTLSRRRTDSALSSGSAGTDGIAGAAAKTKSPRAAEQVLVEVDEADEQSVSEPVKFQSGEDSEEYEPAVGGVDSPTALEMEQTQSEEKVSTTLKEDAQTTDIWIKTFTVQCTKWLITHLNHISWNYRIVAKALHSKQRLMKEQMREHMAGNDEENLLSRPSTTEIEEHQELERGEEAAKEELEKKSLVYRLFNAIFLALISRTEFLCYFTMILCFMCNGSLLSLPLPLLALAWGMLSLPRPAKTFWICVLTYVMVVVVIKFIFQFSFWPWSKDVIKSWNDWVYLIGISTSEIVRCSVADEESCSVTDSNLPKGYYAKFELAVLLSIFIHRTVLKKYGLWRNDGEQEEQLDEDSSREDIVDQGKTNPLVEFDLQNSSVEDVTAAKSVDHVSKGTKAANADKSAPDVGASGEEPNDQLLPADDESVAKGKKAGCGTAVTRWYSELRSGRMFSTGDYYSRMVLCDFVNFIISVIAFQSFGPPQNGTVKDYIQENRVPVPFLILLLCQFILMVVDRAIYLKKHVLAKLVFNIILIIVVHVWVMFILPALTGTAFVHNTVAQLWYFIKCIYFALSAWQIKSGYPAGVMGNFLTTKYSYLNLVLFKIFMAIPFLMELRCIMDWMWTETSFALGYWFMMEDIFAKVYVTKCFRNAEQKYPTERGKNRGPCLKYGLGGFALISLLLIIWFPLLVFSFANTIYNPNPPVECQVTVGVSGFQNLVTVKSQAMDVKAVTEEQLTQLKQRLADNSAATGFLENFQKSDVTVMKLSGTSTAVWGITPPNENAFRDLLNGGDDFKITVTIDFSRASKAGLSSGTITTQFTSDIIANNSEIRTDMIAQMSGHHKPVVLPSMLPRYMHLPVTGEPVAASALHCNPCMPSQINPGVLPYQNLSLSMSNQTGSAGNIQWWSVGEPSNCTQEITPTCGKTVTNYKEIFFVTFNDRVAPDAVSFITGPGILGLYIGMVWLVGQFVRSLTSGHTYRIMFEELPNVDRIMRICKDIYFVREHKELKLEEELFSRLILLYRSPEMLFKWTKIKLD